ncbi:MAG: hypothetical protein ACK55I_07660, partial [bacterium]
SEVPGKRPLPSLRLRGRTGVRLAAVPGPRADCGPAAGCAGPASQMGPPQPGRQPVPNGGDRRAEPGIGARLGRLGARTHRGRPHRGGDGFRPPVPFRFRTTPHPAG